jgi:hypothetical protein
MISQVALFEERAIVKIALFTIISAQQFRLRGKAILAGFSNNMKSEVLTTFR